MTENKRDYKREHAERRKRQKRLLVDIDREKAEAFQAKLKARGVPFSKWINDKIDNEMKSE